MTIYPMEELSEFSRKCVTIEHFSHIGIVDDAIGSNATIHGIASKIRVLNPTVKITAFGIVEPYKGFDVIRDI